MKFITEGYTGDLDPTVGITWERSGDAIIVGKHDVASSNIVLLDSAK